MTSTAPLAQITPQRIRRLLTTLAVGLVAILTLPGTAFATTEPVISGSGTLAAPKPGPAVAASASSASDASSTGWSVGTVLAYALVAALAIAVVVLAQRVLRRRTATPKPVRV